MHTCDVGLTTMPIDPATLPAELVPYAEALDLRPARPIWDVGWRAYEWPAPIAPLIPDAPPYDGVYRGSWISPGVCVRLDLDAVPERVRACLHARHPDRIGGDGALYEFGVASSSQRRNRDDAVLALALLLCAAQHQ
jgi:hypothetical protein